MKTPQTILGVALVVLVVLLFTSPRHRVPMYDASDEVTVQGTVQDVQQFYCPDQWQGRNSSDRENKERNYSGTRRPGALS